MHFTETCNCHLLRNASVSEPLCKAVKAQGCLLWRCLLSFQVLQICTTNNEFSIALDEDQYSTQAGMNAS